MNIEWISVVIMGTLAFVGIWWFTKNNQKIRIYERDNLGKYSDRLYGLQLLSAAITLWSLIVEVFLLCGQALALGMLMSFIIVISAAYLFMLWGLDNFG